MKKIIKLLKASTMLTAFCGLLSIGCLVNDKHKKVERVNADVSQIFTLYDSGERNTHVDYYNESTSASCRLSYTYRYRIYAQKNTNGVMQYKPSVYISYTNGCFATDLDFSVKTREIHVNNTFNFEMSYVNSLPNDASFYLVSIDGASQGDTYCMMNYELTDTIQGDYWETWSKESVFYDYNSNVDETWAIYQYVNFTYSNGENKLQLFDLTSEILNLDIFDVYYQQGVADGYSNGYHDGYANGEVSSQQSSYSEGYSTGSYDGYQEGYAQGQQDASFGSEQYFNNGYQAGYSDGYTEGYNSDATVSSIFSGILQVALVPINFFLAIFNFEILGINLSGFIRALFTVALTIIVIKTIFGGKGASEE